MKCTHCGGHMVYRRTSYSISRRGYHLTIDDIPAWVCTQCGEPIFDERRSEVIRDILERIEGGVQLLKLDTRV